MYLGSGISSQAKVFMQLSGDKGVSQYFELRSNRGGREVFKRGFTDIFLIKLPASLGKMHTAKLVVTGLTEALTWWAVYTSIVILFAAPSAIGPLKAPIPHMVDFNFQKKATNSRISQIIIINRILVWISQKSHVVKKMVLEGFPGL